MEDSDFGNERARAMARLATLQRLKDEMTRNKRAGMLQTIEQMMQAEAEALRRAARDTDDEPA